MNEVLKKRIWEYDNYVKIKGIDETVLDAFTKATMVAFNPEEADEKTAFRVANHTKALIEQFVLQKTGGSIWDLEEYLYSAKQKSVLLDMYYEILLLEAQHKCLDSYFLYLERKRVPKERFYLPKREQFLKIGLTQALQRMLDDEIDILSISMPPGTGKAQPLYSKVLTPNGFVTMGDLSVGDIVISGTGKKSKILGIFPQGVRPIYELTFDDGSKCRCSDEHLWTVQSRDDRRRKNKDGSEKYRTVMLKDMLNNYKVENKKRCNYSVDYVSPVEFAEKDLLLHPYIMGALLGDGGLSCGTPDITTADQQMIDLINGFLPDGYSLKHKDRYTHSFNGHEGNNPKAGSLVTKAIKHYGLFGCHSIDKFIPDEYMHGSYEQRLWLLRGLLDTDGYASKSCAIFTSVSEKLADGVRELVHSLGGYASKTVKKCGYKKNGGYVRCNDAYNIYIQFDCGFDSIFALDRKKYSPKRKKLRRFITDIQYVGEEECQCIYIDDESHLYVTDDYIITHNTTLEKFFNSGIIGWFPEDFTLFFSHSGDITRMYYDSVYQIVSDKDEYTWHDIFPGLKVTNTNAKMEQFNVGKYKPFPSLQCTSIGSSNAGKVRASKYLLCDDLIGGIEVALNKNSLDKLWNIYSVDARQRKIPGCKEIHIATRWSVHDVIGRLERLYTDSDRVLFISVPDIDEETGKSNFDYKYNGFGIDFFHDQELAMDDISYKCLYKNQPIEREGLLYHEEDMRRYASLPTDDPDAILAIIDTKTTGIDYMFMPICYQYGQDFYLVDCICDDSTDFDIQISRICDKISKHKIQKIEVESNAGGSRLAYDVENSLKAQGYNFCSITTRPTETNKETRIIINADWIKKQVLFRHKEEYSNKDDYGRMMSFLFSWSVTGKNKFDDVPDGMANFRLFVENLYSMNLTKITRSPF